MALIDICKSIIRQGIDSEKYGRYFEALKYYEEALNIAKKIPDKELIAICLNSIGGVYFNFGQYDKALGYYDEALKIDKELNIPQSIATDLNNIGGVYLSKKDYKKAEKKFKEAEKEFKKTGYEWGNPGLVELYISTKRYNDALDLLKEMEPRWDDADPYKIQFYTQKGLSLKGKGNFKESSYNFYNAFKISEEMRVKTKERAGFLASGSYGGRISAYKGLTSTIAERVIKGERNDKEFEGYGKDLLSVGYYFSEMTKARVLLETIAEGRKRHIKLDIPEDIKKKEEDIKNQIKATEDQWEGAYQRGEEALKELIKRKEKLKKEMEEIIEEIRKKSPIYASINYPKPIKAEGLPLKEEELMLEYMICEEATYIFKVKKGGVEEIIKIEKGKEEIEEVVKEFLKPFNRNYLKNCSSYIPIAGEGGKYEKEFIKKGKELYKILLEEALRGEEGKEIIIVPDGILGALPFEVLIIEEGRGYKESIYVGDKFKISYGQSGTIIGLGRIIKNEGQKKPLFALGNPIYNKKDPRYIAYKEKKPTMIAEDISKYTYRALSTRREYGKVTEEEKEGCEVEYNSLEETEEEIKAISRVLEVKAEPPDILLGIEANEAKLRKAKLRDYKYIHFATHADLPGKVQGIKEPFILLGQVENEGGEDGFLTLSEVMGLKLDAEVVVLSACNTGRGEAIEGEGVMNFARAFQSAGARSVVVSLWEVPSKETVEYMEEFYKKLKEGKGKGEALREARKKIKERYPNPFYWAPFVLYGGK